MLPIDERINFRDEANIKYEACMRIVNVINFYLVADSKYCVLNINFYKILMLSVT